jgi:hypothetical protein
MVLQVGVVTSQPVDVHWSSAAPNVGTITSNPSFIVGGHTYQFTAITLMSLPIGGVTHRLAFCVDVTVDQTPAWFLAIPNTSALLSPKAGSYSVQDAVSSQTYCALTASSTDDVSVTAGVGYTVHSPAVWNKPTRSWPPTISWSLTETSSGKVLTFTGALTTSADVLQRVVTWQFAGTYQSGGAESDSDWTSTAQSDPFGIRVHQSYA